MDLHNDAAGIRVANQYRPRSGGILVRAPVSIHTQFRRDQGPGLRDAGSRMMLTRAVMALIVGATGVAGGLLLGALLFSTPPRCEPVDELDGRLAEALRDGGYAAACLRVDADTPGVIYIRWPSPNPDARVNFSEMQEIGEVVLGVYAGETVGTLDIDLTGDTSEAVLHGGSFGGPDLSALVESSAGTSTATARPASRAVGSPRPIRSSPSTADGLAALRVDADRLHVDRGLTGTTAPGALSRTRR